MSSFKAFADVAQETTILGSSGQLIISSDDQMIVITGDIELHANVTGLEAAMKIRDALNAVIDAIPVQSPQSTSENESSPIQEKKNPFG